MVVVSWYSHLLHNEVMLTLAIVIQACYEYHLTWARVPCIVREMSGNFAASGERSPWSVLPLDHCDLSIQYIWWAAWHCRNTNKAKLCRAWLVLGLVTTRGASTVTVFIQATQPAIPWWVSAMTTSNGFGHSWGRNGGSWMSQAANALDRPTVTSWWFHDTVAARLVVGLSPLRVQWNGARNTDSFRLVLKTHLSVAQEDD